MAGYLKILRTDLATGTHGRTLESYRLAYVAGGNSWARSFDADWLPRFLVHSIGLTPERASDVMDQARLQGTSNIPGVHMSENETAAMGMSQLPSDEG